MDAGEHGYRAQQVQSALALGRKLVAITPHDTNKLAYQFKYILCGATAGNVAGTDEAGTAFTLPVTAGGILNFIPTVITTASTATPLYGVIE